MDRDQKSTDCDEELTVDSQDCSSSDDHSSSSSSSASDSKSQDPVSDGDGESSDHELPGYDPFNFNGVDEYVLMRRMHKVVLALAADGSEESAQLATLTELCEVLSAMEYATQGYRLKALVQPLVNLASKDGNPKILLQAVRALTYLCDVRPSIAEEIVRHGAIPVLCGKLLAIEYLDVAEQCLEALEKLSKEQPVACLQAGTVNAVLTFIDFLPSNIQQVAVTTITNICKKLPPDCSSIIMEAVPTLCSLLQYENVKLVETVSLCLEWIVFSVRHSPNFMDELFKHGVLQKSLELLANDNHKSLSSSTFSGLMGVLTRLAFSSKLAVRTLFELSISRTLSSILIGSDVSDNSAVVSTEDVQNSQVFKALNLANLLIPPREGNVPNNQNMQAEEKILMDESNFLFKFSLEFLPASIQVVNNGANDCVCYACLSIIKRIARYSTPDMLLESFKDKNISSFLAGLLARKDIHLLTSTMEIVEILMQKLPGVFLSSFVKEGVFYAINMLLMQEESTASAQHSDDKIHARDVSRCLCYVFFSSSIHPSEVRPCMLKEDAVQNLVKHIKNCYHLANGVANSDMSCTKTLQHLKTLCSALSDSGGKQLNDVGDLQDSTQILDEVMREISQGEPLSTFEFVESGIARSLAHYLCNDKYLLGIHDIGLSDHILTVLKKFQIFASICLSKPSQSCMETILLFLVKKLLNALSSLDSFPVLKSQMFKPRDSYTDIPRTRFTKNPSLKVRFVRDKEESNLMDFDKILSVDISCSLVEVVEAYLWPKVSNQHILPTVTVDNHISKPHFTASRLQNASERSRIETHKYISYGTSVSNSSEVIRSEEGQLLPAEISKKLSSDTDIAQGRMTIVSPSVANTKPRLSFSLRGKQLDRSNTLYQAVLEDQISSKVVTIVGSKFWDQVYVFTYKIAEEEKTDKNHKLDSVSKSNFFLNKLGFSWQKLPFFPTKLQAEFPSNIDRANSSYDFLFMWKILEGLNRFSLELLTDERIGAFAEGRIDNFDDLKLIASSVPEVEFVSSKLTDKLEQQMRDNLVLQTGCFPTWCSQLMNACPFLFSFEARLKYFYLTAFGSLRNQRSNMLHSGSSCSNSVSEWHSYSSSPPRKKFKVDRNSILECAAKMMKLHAQSKGSLEVEYEEEVGTGLGPTMEFYTLISQEFQKAGLGMWREDHCSCKSSTRGDSSFLFAPCGLFPRPWSRTRSDPFEFSDVKEKFLLLGMLVARAIKDGRMLDIPLSRAFYKIMLEQELNICDIQSFDPELGRILLEFRALANRKKFVESVSGESNTVPSKLYYRNMSVEDLSLDFTLPGYPYYELASESVKMVNIDNLEEYVALVVDATIGSGVARQINAFKCGFNEVFPLKYLQMFTEDDLERLLCGEQDAWKLSELVDHIKFDHGYNASSPTAIDLLDIIQEFDYDQRRAFLQFVTGAPRLAHGGLAALNPKLTVVRKHSDFGADLGLPSVMTCANYLKLPQYSSKDIMRERLLYAISEGQGSFHLS
ncbi:E3 ubiquitin-protein ligase UPL4-like [Zingiber officinale]|uniref:E3 ubiquitin-protein ligase UPL4-like n=1 Tax=Zingiber officinale TaxID=94328 RepID=UPI001C4B68A0|nr:E3 ubiquitin-protein ligase UPL4-like [Zingiber officinale]